MATAPVYRSALIEALRNAPSDSRGVASRVVLLPNSQDIGYSIPFVPTPRTGLALNPSKTTAPTSAAPPRAATPAAPTRVEVAPAPAAPRPFIPVNRPDDSRTPDPVDELPKVDVPVEERIPVAPVAPVEPVNAPAPAPRVTGGGTTSYPVAPRQFIPSRRLLNPNVTMRSIEDIDPSLRPVVTNPMEDFELDRELGTVQQSDVFGPYEREGLSPDASLAYSPTLTDEYINPIKLTEQDLMEMALFDMLAQQNLTRGAPGMMDEFNLEQ